jgi:hypothetical protein
MLSAALRLPVELGLAAIGAWMAWGARASDLSQHLAKLAEAGFISLSKTFNGNYPQTTAEITIEGRRAVDDHWKRLEAVRRAADAWRRKGGK